MTCSVFSFILAISVQYGGHRTFCVPDFFLSRPTVFRRYGGYAKNPQNTAGIAYCLTYLRFVFYVLRGGQREMPDLNANA